MAILGAFWKFLWKSSMSQIICDLVSSSIVFFIYTAIFTCKIRLLGRRNTTRGSWTLICEEICQFLFFFDLPGSFFALFLFTLLLLTEFLGLSNNLFLFSLFLEPLIFDLLSFLFLFPTLFFLRCFSLKSLIFPSLLFGYALTLLSSLPLLPLHFTQALFLLALFSHGVFTFLF